MAYSAREEEKLLEPIKYYKKEFASKFLDKITARFDELIRTSNIDIERNRKTVAEYNDMMKFKTKSEKILKFLKVCNWISLVIFIICGIIDFNYFSILLKQEDRWNLFKLSWRYPVFSTLLMIFIIWLNLWYIADKKKNCREKIEELSTNIEHKLEECNTQVNALLRLFKSNIANKIITEVIPTLNIDEYFNLERYDNLVKNYNMDPKLDEKTSTLDILSGDILGNPFVVIKTLCNKVTEERYTGSRTVSWTEYYYENGERKSRTVSETLMVTLYKPKQIFIEGIKLIFGSDVAENLVFSRRPEFIHELDRKKLEKHLKNEIKNIRKMSEEAIKKGGTFQEMGNAEFDALFGALDRNHEVEFRVLFTPIAQKNIIELLKDEDFGDDFSFYKSNRLNIISNNNIWAINIGRENYYDFSFDTIKERFFELNKTYFKNLYKLLLPILSIPVYHQHKTKDYIYETDYKYNYNAYVSELMANELGANLFNHPDTGTESILKTEVIETRGDIDIVEVTANSYETVSRVDTVMKTASNGQSYAVPVHWIEYIPVSSCGKMELKRIELDENEFEAMAYSSDEEHMRMRRYSYKNNIFAIFNNSDDIKMKKVLGGKNGE